MDAILYLELRRDAWIYIHNQTEAGRDYLYKAWCLEQTKPDRKKLKKLNSKG